MPDRKPDDVALFAALSGSLPELQPAPDIARAMHDRLMAQVREAPLQVVRAEEGRWVTVVAGIEAKRVRCDERTETTLWRMQPGAVLPAHVHDHDEECLLLEGSLVQSGTEYRAGDYLLVRAGYPHEDFLSPQGALFLIRGERRDSLHAAT